MAGRGSRQAPGQKPSKADRDKSKKNVSESKAAQADAMAVKNFRKRQKEYTSDLANARKIKSAIDAMMKKQEEERALEAKFLNQVLSKVKALSNFSKALAADQVAFQGAVDAPKAYTTAISDARKLPKNPRSIDSFGSLSMALVLVIVILNRLVKLKVK